MTIDPKTIDVTPEQEIFESLMAAVNARESARTVIRAAGEDLRTAELTLLNLVATAYPEDSAGTGVHVQETEGGLQIMLFPPPVATQPIVRGDA